MNARELNNGLTIPLIGFGPGGAGYSAKYTTRNSIPYRAYRKFVQRPQIVRNYVRAIATAIQSGFRLIDYSAAYGDGTLLHKGIEKSGIKRSDLILTTRVSNSAQFNNTVEAEFFSQLKNLHTEYIDILMFHWPVTGHFQSTWKKMVGLYKQGYVRALGVANCKEHHLEALLQVSDIVPAINQFEVHPLFTQKALIEFCQNKNIAVEAYTPIARFDDRLMRLPVIQGIAAAHGKTVPQVVLRWHIQLGLIPIVRSLSVTHQKENIGIFDFELTGDEMRKIDAININARVRYDPDNCDFTVL